MPFPQVFVFLSSNFQLSDYCASYQERSISSSLLPIVSSPSQRHTQPILGQLLVSPFGHLDEPFVWGNFFPSFKYLSYLNTFYFIPFCCQLLFSKIKYFKHSLTYPESAKVFHPYSLIWYFFFGNSLISNLIHQVVSLPFPVPFCRWRMSNLDLVKGKMNR